MAKSRSSHVPTMMVVGLGMILIASLAAVAALAWAHSRSGGPLLARQRAGRSGGPGPKDVIDAPEAVEE